MKKHRLADQLRQRQIDHGEINPSVIHALSDDDIIDAYITCSCCGEKQVEGQALLRAIQRAVHSDDFLDMLSRDSREPEQSTGIGSYCTSAWALNYLYRSPRPYRTRRTTGCLGLGMWAVVFPNSHTFLAYCQAQGAVAEAVEHDALAQLQSAACACSWAAASAATGGSTGSPATDSDQRARPTEPAAGRSSDTPS